jgi:hypothetical protein
MYENAEMIPVETVPGIGGRMKKSSVEGSGGGIQV